VITEEYGVPLDDIAKVNIKGRFQLWRRSTGDLVEIPLKRMAQATREGCKLCPDFAAEHADIATGGIGQRDGWTLAVVRTQRGEDWMREAEADGVIAVRPGEEDPAALALMAKLATRSRERWPVELSGDRAAPRMLPVVQASGGSARST
jgi:coenzyme F420 hydrogenase subunit beta